MKRDDPLFLVWEIRCPNLEVCRLTEQLLRREVHQEFRQADQVRTGSGPDEVVRTEHHRVGDYFSRVEVIPGDEAATLHLLFERRPDAGRFWKDVMVRTLGSVTSAFAGLTTKLIHRGDSAPTDMSGFPVSVQPPGARA